MIPVDTLLTIIGLLIPVALAFIGQQRYLVNKMEKKEADLFKKMENQEANLEEQIDRLKVELSTYKLLVAEKYVTDERLVRTETALINKVDEVARKVDKLSDALIGGAARKRTS